MDIRQLLQSDYLDILFDNRNKRYGGYELRKHYPERARRALLMVLLGAGVAFTIPVIASRSAGTKSILPPVETTTKLDEIKLPKDHPTPPIPPRLAHVPAPPPMVEHVIPKVVPDKVADDHVLKPVDSLEHRVAGPVTTGTGDGPGTITPPGPAGEGKDKEAVEGSSNTAPVRYVEQMPEFSGDIQSYLQHNLHYPESAQEIGYEGKIIIQFVVNEDGSISNTEVLKGGGHGLEQEALRVVAGMPKWKPGKQNGHPVKVYFVLPITFALEN